MTYVSPRRLARFWTDAKNWIAGSSSNLVHRTGDETLDGTKTFNASPIVPEVDPTAAGYTGQEAINYEQARLVSLSQTIGEAYAMQRTGKVYQTRFPLYATATTTAGTKLLDNENLTCVPSTDATEGTDDYADIPLFRWLNCNYIRLADGTAIPTAVEGAPEYKTEGAVDVGTMQMSFWWKYHEADGYCYFTISDSPHPELELVPWYECVKADGTILPYCIGSKYIAGHGVDGKPRSLPGIPLWNRTMSYTTAITNFQTKGSGYWGGGIETDLFQIIFFAVKYADKNMQSIMMGCASYNQTDWVAKAETGVRRILLSSSNEKFVVGSYIQVGTDTDQTDIERNGADHYDVCDHAKITSIEQVTIDGTTYTALNLDLPANIDTTLGGVVQTAPWNAGATDSVLGKHDGSPVSNASGIYPYRIQGREYAIGASVVACNVVLYNGDGDEDVYVANKGIAHSSDTSIVSATYSKLGPAFINSQQNYYIGDISVDNIKAAWFPTAASAGNSTGWCDQCYIRSGNGYASGWRELLWGGRLAHGLDAGPCHWNGYYGLGSANWSFAARD